MKNKFLFLIYICISIIITSCSSDIYLQEQGNTSLDENEYEFSLLVENTSERTRAVDFNPSGALRLNQVWMGVFDMATGECVSKTKKILDYKTVSSGDIHKNLLKI